MDNNDTVQLKKCKKYIMNEQWYFDNFNRHPYVQNCLVTPYKDKTVILTVLDENILPLILILCAGNIKPFNKKITYINTSDGHSTFKDLVEYKCGAIRRIHYTMGGRVKRRPKLVAEFFRNDFLRAMHLWECEDTLEEYMKKYSDDLRAEHYDVVELKIVTDTYIIDTSEDELAF